MLDGIAEQDLTPHDASRLHARRAGRLGTIAFEQARRGEPAAAPAQRALTELSRCKPKISVMIAAPNMSMPSCGSAPSAGRPRTRRHRLIRLTLTAPAGDPGRPASPSRRRGRRTSLVQRCTYGIVWLASAQTLARAGRGAGGAAPGELARAVDFPTERGGLGWSMCSHPGSTIPRRATSSMPASRRPRGAC